MSIYRITLYLAKISLVSQLTINHFFHPSFPFFSEKKDSFTTSFSFSFFQLHCDFVFYITYLQFNKNIRKPHYYQLPFCNERSAHNSTTNPVDQTCKWWKYSSLIQWQFGRSDWTRWCMKTHLWATNGKRERSFRKRSFITAFFSLLWLHLFTSQPIYAPPHPPFLHHPSLPLDSPTTFEPIYYIWMRPWPRPSWVSFFFVMFEEKNSWWTASASIEFLQPPKMTLVS